MALQTRTFLVQVTLSEMDADLFDKFENYLHLRFDGTAYNVGQVSSLTDEERKAAHDYLEGVADRMYDLGGAADATVEGIDKITKGLS